MKNERAFHKASLTFHTTMARAHQDECEKSDMGEGDSTFHAGAASAHLAMGEYHCACLKADSDELGKSAPSVPAITVDEQFRKLVLVDEDEQQWKV